MFPGIDFLRRLENDIVASDNISFDELDFPIIKAGEFYRIACDEVKNRDFLAVLKKRSEDDPSSYWTFSDFKRLADYIRNYSDADSVLDFIKDVLNKVIGDLEWKSLVRIAKGVKSLDDFIDACRGLRILGSDASSNAVRKIFTDLVKRYSGKDYSLDLNVLDIRDVKSSVENVIVNKLDKFAKVEDIKNRLRGKKIERQAKIEEIIGKISKIPDDSGWVRYLVSKYNDGGLDWDNLQRELLNKTSGKVRDEIFSIIKASGFKKRRVPNNNIIRKIEDYGVKEGKIRVKGDKEDKDKKDKGKENKKSDEDGSLMSDYVTEGYAVRIEGNPASPYYGKVGIVEWVKDDGWVGINLRNGDYVERWIEDVVPVTKKLY